MEVRNLRCEAHPPHRGHLSAIIASLFASLLLLFGSDVFGRSYPGMSTNAAMSRADAGQILAGGKGDTRFLTASDPSSRLKLRPSASGDGCLATDLQTLWLCRHGDLLQVERQEDIAFEQSRPYWSRAPPQIQHSA